MKDKWETSLCVCVSDFMCTSRNTQLHGIEIRFAALRFPYFAQGLSEGGVKKEVCTVMPWSRFFQCLSRENVLLRWY